MWAFSKFQRLLLPTAMLLGGVGDALAQFPFPATARRSAIKVIYTYTGGDQTFVVPAGVDVISVKAWGAGGAGGQCWNPSTWGGAGGYTASTLAVTPGETLTIVVGGGGIQTTSYCGGGGGGRSAIRRGSADILTAGGGGGGGYSGHNYGYYAGTGGGSTGGTGYTYSGTPAYGGTQSSGGSGASTGSSGVAGSQYQGGSLGGWNSAYGGGGSSSCGGGGGGGYYGGGSGDNNWCPTGAGGSGFVPWWGTTVNGSSSTPPYTGDSDYVSGVGSGSAYRSYYGYDVNGGHGRVVITYGSSQCQSSSYTLNYTGAITTFTPPPGCYSLTIEAWGAQGGPATWYSYNGGYGAYSRGDFTGKPDTFKVLVGGMGGGGYYEGGGGGGTFVTDSANVPFIIAGGGGGTYFYTAGQAGQATTSGGNPPNGGGSGGSNGSGGGTGCYGANGAGGLTGDGDKAGCYGSGSIAYAFINGGAGGTACSPSYAGAGGFGGGSGGEHCYNGTAGSGGGYSGGGGGNGGAGAGGGSYVSGLNTSVSSGARSGHGMVTFTYSAGTKSTIPITAKYATVQLSGGNKRLVFLFAPKNTQINSNAQYKAFCESKGFSQNQNSSTQSTFTNAGMSSSTAYYATQYCSYLGSGSGQSSSLSGFTNYGLPLNTWLQVFDRGCGDYTTSYNTGVVTVDGLNVSGTSSYSYSANYFGSVNFNTSKTTTFAYDGVVVCQEP